MADDGYRRGELPGQQQDVVLQWGEPADGRLAALLVYLSMQQVNYSKISEGAFYYLFESIFSGHQLMSLFLCGACYIGACGH